MNIYRKTWNLFVKFKTEIIVYAAVCLITSALYLFICGMLGLSNPYVPTELLRTNTMKMLTVYAFGTMINAWFTAGIAGKFTAELLTGAPREIRYYANGWFLQKFTADIIFACAIYTPVLLLSVISLGIYTGFAVWFVFCVWFCVRLSLWLNASLDGDPGFIAAMKRSFVITRGHVMRIITLCLVPMIVFVPINWLLRKALASNVTAVFFANSLVNGIVSVIFLGVFASLYADIKSAANAARTDNGTVA